MDNFEYKKTRSLFWIHVFDNGADGVVMYAERMLRSFIDFRFPQLSQMAGGSWKETSTGKCYLRLTQTDAKCFDWQAFHSWADHANSCLWIGLNGRTEGLFANDALDCCLALGFNYNFDGSGRTSWGECEFTAKYHGGDSELLNQICQGVVSMAELLPIGVSRKYVVSGVPYATDRGWNFGARMAALVADALGVLDVTPRLNGPKPQMKGLSTGASISAWRSIYTGGIVQMDESYVRDADVVIVDDLYQSGVTIWSFAEYLKRLGAKRVFALCCVKSINDVREDLS